MNTHESVLLAGAPTQWRRNAAERLGIHMAVSTCDSGQDALRELTKNPAIRCAVISDEGRELSYFPAVRAMLKLRPDLHIFVLVGEVNQRDMLRFMQLGQRDAGQLMVHYFENPYNYDWIATQILGVCSENVENP